MFTENEEKLSQLLKEVMKDEGKEGFYEKLEYTSVDEDYVEKLLERKKEKSQPKK